MHPPLAPLPTEPRPGRYRHYKGGEYRVLHLARHSETNEVLVVYEIIQPEPSFWVRPAAMFVETVVLPSGERAPRFAFVSSE